VYTCVQVSGAYAGHTGYAKAVRAFIDVETRRLNFEGQRERLVAALVTWRAELAADIQRADARGFRKFANDLRVLARRVDQVLEAARG
jgi:hypothetical protein